MIANPRHVDDARRRCCEQTGDALADIEVVPIPTDDSWGDSAPTFLIGPDGEVGAIEWRFTGWGSFRDDYAETAMMAGCIIDLAGARRCAAPLASEADTVLYSAPEYWCCLGGCQWAPT